jgi:hypothetical protein
MSLFLCPECSHEVSEAAVTCPSCGRPLKREPVRKVVTATNVRPKPDGLPAWAIAAMIFTGLLLVTVIFLLARGSSDEGNMNLAVNASRPAETIRDSRPPVDVPSSSSSVPSTATMPQAPVSEPPPSSSTTVPGGSADATAPPPTRGAVTITAKTVNSRGDASPARNARFYLLEKDVETILREARVTPIEGNTLTGSLGLATANPSRFGDFQRAAMRALAANAKYTGATNAAGSASLAGVEPRQYYLFCITKVGNGFAMWDSPITVQAGDNKLDLSPARVTEISEG